MKPAKTLAILAVFTGLASLHAAAGQDTAAIDNNFLTKDAACENGEIEFCKLAPSRAATQSVKDLAAEFLKDHTAAFDKLAQLFKNRKIAIVAGTDKEFRDEYARLAAMKGAQFDRAFLQRMVDDHKKAIQLFENQVNHGKDSDITAYAKDSLPTLKMHLKKAQEVATSLPQ